MCRICKMAQALGCDYIEKKNNSDTADTKSNCITKF